MFLDRQCLILKKNLKKMEINGIRIYIFFGVEIEFNGIQIYIFINMYKLQFPFLFDTLPSILQTFTCNV